jgi:hypothetical protein
MTAYTATTTTASTGPAARTGRGLRRAVTTMAAAATVTALGAVLAATAASAAVAAPTTTAATAATAAAAPARNWIGTGWNNHLIYTADPATTTHFYGSATSFGTGSDPAASPITDSLATSGLLDYSSYAQFSADISSGAIAGSYHWVMYDPEQWSQTPQAEQLNPAKYLAAFGKLAHAHGLKVIETPARDLGNVATTCPLNTATGENLDQWYIRCNIAGAAAASSDIYVLQDQVNTTNLTEYKALFTQARTQALAANPTIATDTEISTNYGTPTDMATAAKSVPASGYYLSTTSPNIPQADQFLHIMQTAGY